MPTGARSPVLAAALLLLATLTEGCLLDTAPRRAPLDRVWEEWMLAGYYVAWSDGIVELWPVWDATATFR
jgi:hypothetical protein